MRTLKTKSVKKTPILKTKETENKKKKNSTSTPSITKITKFFEKKATSNSEVE